MTSLPGIADNVIQQIGTSEGVRRQYGFDILTAVVKRDWQYIAAAKSECAMVQRRHQREVQKEKKWSERLGDVADNGTDITIVVAVGGVWSNNGLAMTVVVAVRGVLSRQQIRQQQLLLVFIRQSQGSIK